jgi:tetratricopeptide (TPR) repeat protein
MGNYHPLTMISLAIDYQISGINPFTYHFTNLLLHASNAVLVFLIIFALTGKFNLSVIAGLLFGVHTLHVESVSWVSERKDVLYAFFYLLALYSYVRYNKKKERKWYWFSISFFILSLFSKGQAVSLAVTLFLVDYLQGKKLFDAKSLIDKVPYFILAAIFGMVAIQAQQGVSATEMVHTEGQQRIFFSSYGFLLYLGKLILPIFLSAYYPYPNLSPGADLPIIYYLSPIFVVAFFSLLFFTFKRSKPVFFGLSFFLVNIFLLLQLLPVGGAIMADRYAYIPSFGYCFLFGYIITEKKFLPNINAPYIFAGIYLLLLGAMTFGRTMTWKNNFTLWTDVVQKNSEIPLAWYNLGNAHSDTGNYAVAISNYDQSIRVSPLYYSAYINRANAKTKTNDYVGAIEDLNFVISHDSSLVNAYINRALARRSLKDYKGAIADYEVAIRMKPDQPELYLSRGNVLFDMNDNTGALKDFTKALEIKPGMLDAYANRAFVKKAMGNLAGAIGDYDKAIEIQPENSEFYNNRGNLRFQLGQNKEAIADYGRSMKAKPKDYLAYKNRGAIYFIQKDYQLALNDYSEAIRFNTGMADLWFTRALIKKAMNDMTGATADYKKAVETDPNFGAESYSKNLGLKPIQTTPPYEQFNKDAQVLDGQGKYQEAISMYKRAIELKADYYEAWFNLGNTYGKTGKFVDAIASFNRAIAAKKDYAEAFAGRGIANASVGKFQEALKDMSAAIKIKPDYAMVFLNRALIYLNTGKKDLACVDLQKAVQLGYKEAYEIYQKECQGKSK